MSADMKPYSVRTLLLHIYTPYKDIYWFSPSVCHTLNSTLLDTSYKMGACPASFPRIPFFHISSSPFLPFPFLPYNLYKGYCSFPGLLHIQVFHNHGHDNIPIPIFFWWCRLLPY